jgi:hypothetical protein
VRKVDGHPPPFRAGRARPRALGGRGWAAGGCSGLDAHHSSVYNTTGPFFRSQCVNVMPSSALKRLPRWY